MKRVVHLLGCRQKLSGGVEQGFGKLLNAVCQFTNNIRMKATSRAQHFYVFGLHSQLPDLNSKRIRDKFV